MKIKYHDVLRKPLHREAEIDAEFFPGLDDMLAISDCVVLATPASPDGRKLIDKSRLEKMKWGSRFVNIARGSLVDEEAVADAVEQGRLVGVGLDVHEFEPRVNERLKKLRAVMLTSHNAGGTLDTYGSLLLVLDGMMLMFYSHVGFELLAMRNIDAVLKGKDALTPVNKHMMSNAEKSKL